MHFVSPLRQSAWQGRRECRRGRRGSAGYQKSPSCSPFSLEASIACARPSSAGGSGPALQGFEELPSGELPALLRVAPFLDLDEALGEQALEKGEGGVGAGRAGAGEQAVAFMALVRIGAAHPQGEERPPRHGPGV